MQIGARFLSAITFDYSNANATFQQVMTGLTLAANNPLGLPAGTPVDAILASQFTSGALVSQSRARRSPIHGRRKGESGTRVSGGCFRPRLRLRGLRFVQNLPITLQRAGGGRWTESYSTRTTGTHGPYDWAPNMRSVIR